MNGFPRLAVGFENDKQHFLNDALLGQGEVTSLHAGMEAAIATEHIVHHQKCQVWIKNEQTAAAQGLGLNDVEIGWHMQVADEFAKL